MARLLRRAALPGALVLGLAACFGGTKSTGKLVCPTPLIAPDLDAAAQWRPGGSGPEDVSFGVKLLSVNTVCRTEKIGLNADARISFIAARTDPTMKRGDFAYFVAVADAQRNILNKKEYKVSVEFAPRQKRLQVSDTVAIGLPVRDLSFGGKYLIIVGLQLSPEQLDFNRKQAQAPPPQPAPAAQSAQ
jgi:hypothetical protein